MGNNLTPEEWDKKIEKLQSDFAKKMEIKYSEVSKSTNELNKNLAALKSANEVTYINNVPIIENNEELDKLSKDEVMKLLNYALVYDIKDINKRKPKIIGMFMSARFEESENTYYGDIRLSNNEYKKFKQIKYQYIYNDVTNKLEFISFYVKKI